MLYLIFRIIEKVLIIYFAAYLLIDVGLFVYSLYVFRGRKSKKEEAAVPAQGQEVSVIVPAFNEEVSIVHCVKMLLQADYPGFEVIVVNDGSTDNTLQALKEAFDLRPADDVNYSEKLKTREVRQIFKYERSNGGGVSTRRADTTGAGDLTPHSRFLLLIDKQNGGKADAVNAGINYARGRYICTVDADSILDSNALREVVQPFLQSNEVVVAGGQLAASNGLTLEGNRVVSARTPSNIWVLWQIIEYIKSFMVSRIGLSKLNALLIMSGAFSLYRKEDLLKAGGFLTPWNDHPYVLQTVGPGKQTVCEDMEIVLRLVRYRREQGLKAKTRFLPRPVCWTEVPDNARNLYRQRSRWQQGLAESLKLHKSMIFEPAYGATGMLGLPYYNFFELLAPPIKILTIVFVVAAAALGIINYRWVLLLLIGVILLTALVTSSITAMVEYWSYRQSESNRQALRYRTFGDWLWLITAGILGEFSYAIFKLWAQLAGLFNFMRKKSEWKKFERKGVEVK